MIKAKTICRASYIPSNLMGPLEHWTVIHSMTAGFADETACPFRTNSFQIPWLSTAFTDGICIVQRI
jgi:hypothetical protein